MMRTDVPPRPTATRALRTAGGSFFPVRATVAVLLPDVATKKTTIPADIGTVPLVDEPDARQFVMQVGSYRARMEYERSADRIFLTHVEVPPAIENHGVAAVLTEKVLHWIEDNKLKLVPYCPYVKTYLRRNTAWQRLLLKGVQI